MRLVVLGGSGRTGVHLIEQALKRGESYPNVRFSLRHTYPHLVGHNVTALVRNPAKLPIRTGLDICEGALAGIHDLIS
jgi:uncharacterized protein YbjT (DUF2867 family)